MDQSQKAISHASATANQKRPVILLLNKLFHDEYLECSNLIAALEMLRQSCDPAIEQAAGSLAAVLTALNARKAMSEKVSPYYYELRDALEAR